MPGGIQGTRWRSCFWIVTRNGPLCLHRRVCGNLLTSTSSSSWQNGINYLHRTQEFGEEMAQAAATQPASMAGRHGPTLLSRPSFIPGRLAAIAVEGCALSQRQRSDLAWTHGTWMSCSAIVSARASASNTQATAVEPGLSPATPP